MGCGKTTTGKILAGTLERPFVDLDDWVERAAGMDVRTVFETQGESTFRELETEALERATEIYDAVVATGGGTVTVERNRSWIRRHGVSVWLHLPFEAIQARVGGVEQQRRPLFQDESQTLDLYRERLSAYRGADFTIEIDAKEEARDVATRIVRIMGDRVCNS